ncbi:MAG: serine hydrolase [Acidimicrobiales bacterium]
MGAPELSRRRERSVSRPLSMSRAAAVGVAAVALIASVGVAAASPGSASGQTRLAAKGSSTPLPSLGWALPAAPVGRQLGWLVGAVRRPPIPAAVLRAHFDAAFLEHVSPRTFNAALAGLHVGGAWRIVTLDATTSPGELAVSVLAGSTRFGVEISVDAKGLIDGLLVQPVPAVPSPPRSWQALDAKLSALAPDVGFEAATLSSRGSCTSVHVLSPSTARPLGSLFKVFVLGALARAVRAGTLSWHESVALQANLTSLPSGVLQVEPAGTAYTVAQYAELMISSSDNTAADRLAALVGRGAIEAQVRRWSSHVSLDTPFLRTREFFVLKYADYPRYADAYLALSPKARDGYLGRVVDKVSLSAIHLSQAELVSPRQIDDIEWFASPSDLCRAFAGLYADAHGSSLTPIATAMSLSDGGLGLNPLTWPQVWFKGGSETGVLTLGFLARDRSGRVVVVVALLSNPRGSLDEATVATELLSIVRGAFRLVD